MFFLGFALESFEFVLESSLLVLMILGIRKIFAGKIRYAGIYALWFLVLLRFMIPVNIVSTPFSVGMFIPEALSTQENGDIAGKNQKEITGEVNSFRADEISGKDRQAGRAENQSDSVLALQGINQGQQSDSGSLIGSFHINWRVFVRNGRLIISGLILLWFVMSNVLLIRKLKRNRVLYGKRNTVKIYVTSGVKNPCLYGFLRPAIYIPKGLVGYGEMGVGESEIEQIITHEYVHYRHGDHIWAMLRMLLVSMYWVDPFLWMAVSCSKKDAELFCDETVIRLLGEENRFHYGKMLVRLAGDASWGEFRYPIMSMSRRGKEMEKRIRAISSKKSYSRWKILPLVLLVLLAAGITCSAASVPSVGEVNQEEQTENSVSGAAVGVENGEKNRKTQVSAQQSSMSSTDNGYVTTYGGDVSELPFSDVKAIEQAFGQYIEIFTAAVNTGNSDNMYQVLYEGSDVYVQQCELVKNYYKRGIKEKVKTCSISSLNVISPTQVEIISMEKIKVFYTDTEDEIKAIKKETIKQKSKLIKQQYLYTCEYIDEQWIITGMDDIS
ncbi:MAG: hypothetical protein J1F22_05450 [Lachnospiraceae bacterium]|nr:hypothetical protein [Lachnospiraceae bacterium]